MTFPWVLCRISWLFHVLSTFPRSRRQEHCFNTETAGGTAGITGVRGGTAGITGVRGGTAGAEKTRPCALRCHFLIKTVKGSNTAWYRPSTTWTSAGAGGGHIASLCPLPRAWEGTHRLIVSSLLKTGRQKVTVTLSDSSVTARVSGTGLLLHVYRVACWDSVRDARGVPRVCTGWGIPRWCTPSYTHPVVYPPPSCRPCS